MERYSDPFEDFDLHRDNPAIAVRPPCIALTFLAVGLAIDQFTSAPFLYEPVQYLGGAGLAASAMRRFRAAGTAVETSRPSVTIVSDRPYAGTRNPIYVAMLLIYAGIVVVANAPAVVALMPVLFAVLHFGVGLREEDYLECKFGDAYLAYKLAVPRWL